MAGIGYWVEKGELTPDQIRDLYKAGRSPKTGRRYRTTPPTALERKCKQVNWAKLTTKGASMALLKALDHTVITDPDRIELEKTIKKLEQLVLNKLTEGYEVTRFEYWQQEASSKK